MSRFTGFYVETYNHKTERGSVGPHSSTSSLPIERTTPKALKVITSPSFQDGNDHSFHVGQFHVLQSFIIMV